MLTTQVRSE